MSDKKHRVLAVDDRPENIELLATILSDRYEVSVALNGSDALQLANKLQPDLIMLDILLPDMDGYEVCRRLKQNDDTRDIPVIFATSLDDPADESNGFALGGVDYLTKPFNPDLVLARVGTHLALYDQSRLLEDLVERRTHQLLEAKQEAEEANRAKSVFLANMSHELRTPLNGVLGICQLLLSDEPNPDQRELLIHQRDSANMLLRIVNDLLELSSFEAGMIRLSNKAVNVRELLQPLVRTCSAQAQLKGLSFEADIDPAVPETITADPARVRQTLTNLLDNALKFTSQGGVVLTVGAEETEGCGGYLTFSVRDTGIGIPEDKLAHVFERFAIAEDHLTKQYGGTGLGLSIARELASEMGGSIEAASTQGKGSTFTFTLPCELTRNPACALSDKGAAEAEQHPAHTILLVEDEPVSRLMTARQIRNLGHAVTEAADGMQALAALKNERFDVVLMDVQMPNLNGIDTVRRIRAGEDGIDPALPVIGLSAYARDKDIRIALEAGMDDYVTKPFEVNDLVSALSRLLERKQDAPD